MHRQFLEIIKNELDNTDVRDINNAQAFMLCNIGDDELTIGELSLRGYYLGTNVSYTIKKMTEYGYINHERLSHDHRSVRVRLTEKGLELSRALETMFERHSEEMANNLNSETLETANDTLSDIESVWLQQLGFEAKSDANRPV